MDENAAWEEVPWDEAREEAARAMLATETKVIVPDMKGIYLLI